MLVCLTSHAQETDALAQAHAELACGFDTQAARTYCSMLSGKPGDVQAILGLAQAQWSSGQDGAAGLTLERAVAGGVESAPVYAMLGEVYVATNHPENAVEVLKRAIALQPRNPALRVRYDMLLLNLKAPKAAELRTRQAVEQFPQSARLWFVLGMSQFDQAEPAPAQVSFDRAIALDPAFAPALAYRGLCALDQQRYAEAEARYRKGIALDPDAADLHAPSDWHTIGP